MILDLPEARRLPRELDRIVIRSTSDRLPEWRREVVFNSGKHWQRNSYYRVRSGYRSRLAGTTLMIDDQYSVRECADLANLCSEPDSGMKLDYFKELGITTLWLLPFYPSPMKDDGYDTAAESLADEQYVGLGGRAALGRARAPVSTGSCG